MLKAVANSSSGGEGGGGVASVNSQTGAVTLQSSGASITITEPSAGVINLESVSGGSGTVTSVSGVNTNGFSFSIANATSTPAITLKSSLGTGIVPQVNSSGALVASGITVSGGEISTALNTLDDGFGDIISHGNTVAGYSLSANFSQASGATISGVNSSNTTTFNVALDSGDITAGVWNATKITPTYGGTGLATLTAHAVMLGEGTSNVGFATIGTSGRLLIDQGASADPSFNAMSGDATITNAGAITIANNAVTYAKIQNESASTLLGNPTGSGAAPSEITLGSGLSFSGTTLTASGSGGTVTSVSGTSNRITSTGGTTPVIDISASYVGQSSITTLGTVSTGIWQGTKVGDAYGGTNADSSSATGVAQVSSGTWSFSTALANGTTATTQSALDNSTKVSTTAYTDAAVATAVAGINPAVAVQAATTSASNTSTYTYNNGVAGVGATFTAGSNNVALTVDGYTFTAVGQRLLVKNDTQSPSGAFNGVYYVTQLQTSLLPVILTRALDYDQPSDINNTGAIPVINGTVNAATTWIQTAQVVTVGTTPLVYVQFSYNPSSIVTTFSGGTTGLTPSSATSGTVTLAGTLIVGNGGTGAATLTGLVVGNGTSAMTAVTAPSGTVVGTTDTQTLSAKRITRRVNTTTSSATPAINTDTTDLFTITALATAVTSFTSSLSGTPINGDVLEIRILDNGTPQSLTWGTSFASTLTTLPTTTVASTTLRILVEWNSASSKWECTGVT